MKYSPDRYRISLNWMSLSLSLLLWVSCFGISGCAKIRFGSTASAGSATLITGPTSVSGNTSISLPACTSSQVVIYTKTDSNSTRIQFSATGTDTIDGLSRVYLYNASTLTFTCNSNHAWTTSNSDGAFVIHDFIVYGTGSYPPGSYTFTVPSSITRIQVSVFGAGGGGGGLCGAWGMGGSGGGYTESGTVSVTPGSSYTVVVGAGGGGSVITGTNTGANGGDSSFTGSGISLLATGGGGSGGFCGGPLGAQGVGSGGTLNYTGGTGQSGWSYAGGGGAGAGHSGNGNDVANGQNPNGGAGSGSALGGACGTAGNGDLGLPGDSLTLSPVLLESGGGGGSGNGVMGAYPVSTGGNGGFPGGGGGGATGNGNSGSGANGAVVVIY